MGTLFSIVSWIFSNLLTLGIIGVVFYLLFFRRRKALINKLSQPPQPTGTRGERFDEYSGQTGGISWKLKSSIVRQTTGRNRTWLRATRWETPAVKFPTGKYLMLMSVAGDGIPKGPVKQEGFLNTIINKAADFAVDVYVGTFFGAEYQSMINVTGDSIKMDLPDLPDFLILTNHEAVAKQFLHDSTTAVIAQWKKQKMGFAGEGQVDQFGLLFCQDGVILSCKADMANEQEARMFADFGSVLSVKMQQIVSNG